MPSTQESLTEWQPLPSLLQAGLMETCLLSSEKHLLEKVFIKEHNVKKRKGPDDVIQCLDAALPKVTITSWVVKLPEETRSLSHFSYSRWNYISGIHSGMSSDLYTHIRISRLQCKKSTKASCFHLWFTAGKMHAYYSHYTRIWWAARVSKLQNTNSIFNFYVIK